MINDYELIYLYQTFKDEKVLQLIIDKYRPLIYKKIYSFGIEGDDVDDFYQEATITLHKAIMTFDESKNKTFTRYFELILVRRFIALRKKLPKHFIIEDIDLIGIEYEEKYDVLKEPATLSKFESEVYNLYVNLGYTIKSIAEKFKTNEKSIKNTIYRIKVKINNK